MTFLKTTTTSVCLMMKVGISGNTYNHYPGQFIRFPDGLIEPYESFVKIPLADGTFRAVIVPAESIPLSIIEPAVVRRATFTQDLPPPPPRPVLLTRAQVLARLHLTEAELDEATYLGFPRPVRTRGSSDGQLLEPFWKQAHVDEWERRRAMIGARR